MELSTTQEATSCTATKNLQAFLGKPKGYFRIKFNLYCSRKPYSEIQPPDIEQDRWSSTCPYNVPGQFSQYHPLKLIP
jgi:hypothetical protein